MKYKPKKNWRLDGKNATLRGIAAEILDCDPKQVDRYMEDERIRWEYVAQHHRMRLRILHLPDVMKMKKLRDLKKRKRKA